MGEISLKQSDISLIQGSRMEEKSPWFRMKSSNYRPLIGSKIMKYLSCIWDEISIQNVWIFHSKSGWSACYRRKTALQQHLGDEMWHLLDPIFGSWIFEIEDEKSWNWGAIFLETKSIYAFLWILFLGHYLSKTLILTNRVLLYTIGCFWSKWVKYLCFTTVKWVYFDWKCCFC